MLLLASSRVGAAVFREPGRHSQSFAQPVTSLSWAGRGLIMARRPRVVCVWGLAVPAFVDCCSCRRGWPGGWLMNPHPSHKKQVGRLNKTCQGNFVLCQGKAKAIEVAQDPIMRINSASKNSLVICLRACGDRSVASAPIPTVTFPAYVMTVRKTEMVPCGGTKKTIWSTGAPHQVMSNTGPGTLLVETEILLHITLQSGLISIRGPVPKMLKSFVASSAWIMSSGADVRAFMSASAAGTGPLALGSLSSGILM
mmetsp:Transcript_65887/g.129872  ORF Transcript_65887/g.129872 Transcript_65887/m.129872 type:complete len:254 (+) Transcript_65887:225-986(+)